MRRMYSEKQVIELVKKAFEEGKLSKGLTLQEQFNNSVVLTTALFAKYHQEEAINADEDIFTFINNVKNSKSNYIIYELYNQAYIINTFSDNDSYIELLLGYYYPDTIESGLVIKISINKSSNTCIMYMIEI